MLVTFRLTVAVVDQHFLSLSLSLSESRTLIVFFAVSFFFVFFFFFFLGVTPGRRFCKSFPMSVLVIFAPRLITTQPFPSFDFFFDLRRWAKRIPELSSLSGFSDGRFFWISL